MASGSSLILIVFREPDPLRPRKEQKTGFAVDQKGWRITEKDSE
jgi:hypothetical protein